MKILLIQPPISTKSAGLKNIHYFLPPMSLETVAASVRDRHEVRIVDMRVEPDIYTEIDSYQPAVVGCSSCTPDAHVAAWVLSNVKERYPDIHTVIGGIHASMVPEYFHQPGIDAICIGEGEETFPELLSAWSNGGDLRRVQGIAWRNGSKFVRNEDRPLIADLDSSPPPARDLTKRYYENYWLVYWNPIYLVETARGCPYRCNFCCGWKYCRGKYRTRSPEKVAEHIANVPGRYICLSDDNFMENPKRARKIHDLLKERKIRKKYLLQARCDTIVRHPRLIHEWADIGLEIAALGTEGFRDEDLKRMNKRCDIATNEKAVEILHDAGIKTWGSFIVLPDFSRTDFRALAEYVRKVDFTFVQYTILTPLPGTDLHTEMEKDILIHDYEQYDLLHAVVPTRLPAGEFYRCFAELYRDFYLSKRRFVEGFFKGRMPMSWKGIMHGLRMVRKVADVNHYTSAAG